MSIIRKVFMSIIRCIGYGFVGALGALMLAFCLFLLLRIIEVFMSNPSSMAGPGMGVVMMGFYGIFVGFALGAIYGAIRTLTNLNGRTVLIAMLVISATIYLMVLWLVVF